MNQIKLFDLFEFSHQTNEILLVLFIELSKVYYSGVSSIPSVHTIRFFYQTLLSH